METNAVTNTQIEILIEQLKESPLPTEHIILCLQELLEARKTISQLRKAYTTLQETSHEPHG